ncbi:MAG: DUF2970 domain-containing protein [Burkholderiales bacterium]|nr:DUF2970 domain-containing protein [Burkholderiales bacterium]
MAGAMRESSFADTVKTVLAGAVGIRRRAEHERARLDPVHLVVAAVLFVLLFVGTLVAIARIVAG